MRIEVCEHEVHIHLINYLYRLRMAESHLESRQQQLGWSSEDVFVLQLIRDLLGACEDATSIIRQALVPEGPRSAAQDGLGEDRG